ncbi:transglycosylase domain-containing protein [Kitasatospora sp. NPDC004615]|uniref:transglycosylase domain-containing protein n=1 Tax=Kitasatospora sp. NPDC004615 TaxID=3364017 RepID=UPI00369273A3
MSEHRRRSANPGGEEPPSRRASAGRPYAYGSPVEGAPDYAGEQGGPASGPGRPGPGAGPGGRRPARETAQQPRMTRAEMRKQGRKGGGDGGSEGPPNGRNAGRNGKPGKKRLIDYPRFGKSGFKRWMPSWKQVLSLFLIFFGGGVAAIGVAYAVIPVPSAKDSIKLQNNIYYWADNTEMARKGDTNKQWVELSEISRPAQDAVIAAENETFRTDSGIDPKGIARAVYKMATGGETQGGSTITQQYVKNVYLSQEQTLSRKAKEFIITLKIADDKDGILTGYLNTSWYGRGATGIQAASQAYYGVDANKVDICQGAMLAGLLKGAALYDPTLNQANHDRMQERWNYVLDRMQATKAITAEDRAKCGQKFPEPIAVKAPASLNGEVSYLVDTANQFIMAKDKTITEAKLARGGYQIYTTFEKDKVDALKTAVDQVKGEILDESKREADKFVQVGAASVRPNDGAIVAIYGGDGIEKGHYSNNADSKVPVGSTFKPFVLAAAMQYGVQTKSGTTQLNPDSLYLADNLSPIYRDGKPLTGDDGKPYKQRNDSPGSPGYVSLKKAMQYSYNVPFVQLGQDVGGKTVEKMVTELGILPGSLEPSSTLTFPLGTSHPSSIRMASAYSVFAARGQQTDPYSVSKVMHGTEELPNFGKPQPKKALEQAVADNITDVLENVAKNGTGKKGTESIGRPVAGKTGTTDAGTSAWWAGYTPDLSTAVGMWREEAGNPKLLSLNGTAGHDSVHGGDFPTEIFARYMKIIMKGKPVLDFPNPAPWGQEVDSSGAPISPSAPASTSASAPAEQSTGPTEPSTSKSPEGPLSPSPSNSSTCQGNGNNCGPSRSPKPSKSPSESASGSPSAPPGGGGGGGGTGNLLGMMGQ